MDLNPHIGQAFEATIKWLLVNLSGLFDVMVIAIGSTVDAVAVALVNTPFYITLTVLTLLAIFITRSIGVAIFTVLAFGLIYISELWEPTMESLALVLVSVFISLLIGIPLGIWASQSNRVSNVIRPILDVMQAMPSFVYLIPAVFFFGIGMVPGIMATIVFALPPGVRLTELGIRQLDGELIEAAEAFGAKRGLMLRDIEIPLAFPSIMAGVNQVIMMALSMVVVAGMVGAGGLGGVVVQGIATLNAAKGFEGGVAVVILAIYLDRVTGGAKNISDYIRARRMKKGQAANEARAKAALV